MVTKKIYSIFCFVIFLISYAFGYKISGYFQSCQYIDIIDKKLQNTIFVKGEFGVYIQQKYNTLNLLLNLYNVSLAIYEGKNLKVSDRYDKYRKDFAYKMEDGVLIDNTEDVNPWSFIKPIMLCVYMKKNFSIQTSKNLLIFEKRNDIFFIEERYKDMVLSNGRMRLGNKRIDFEFSSYLPKKKIPDVNFEMRYYINSSFNIDEKY